MGPTTDAPHARVLLVGPHPSDKAPLTPLLASSTSRRIADWMGLPSDQCPGYLGLFERANLCVTPCYGSVFRARARAALKGSWETINGYRRVVFLGSQIRHAFDDQRRRWYEWWHLDAAETTAAVYVPHPSGRNRRWNQESAVSEARQFWRGLFSMATSGI